MFYLVVALVESISVPLRTQATFLLLSVGTNVIIMPSRFLYKEHVGVGGWVGGWVMVGWGGSCRGGVGHGGVRWVM